LFIFDLSNEKEMTIETATEKAIELTIIDAIEKGHTEPAELIAYMESETFKTAALNYRSLLLNEFAN
jgi:hypothetical protein